MKMVLTIECNCGNIEEVALKRTTEEFEGRIYEDYFSIADSFNEKSKFKAYDGPQEVTLVCKVCDTRLDLL